MKIRRMRIWDLKLLGILASLFLLSPTAFADKECIADRYIAYGSELAIRRTETALADQTGTGGLQRAEEIAGYALLEDLGSPTLRRSDLMAVTFEEDSNQNLCKRAKKSARSERSRARRNGTYSIVRNHTTSVKCECDSKLEMVATPNDSLMANLWGMHQAQNDIDIDAPEAWNLTTGSENTIVAVIDTGIDYNHPDLKDNVWINPGEIPGNGIDDDKNGVIDDIHGFNAVNNSGDPFDDQGHGTHCAGTIGGVGNNAQGVAGVNWKIKIIGVKFLTASGSGSLYDAIEGLNYIRTLREVNGINVVLTSNSWGGGGYSPSLVSAISALKIPFIAAAGNSGQNSDVNPGYPAAYPLDNIISVAAVDKNGALASFSNYGATSVDLGAPGVSIASSIPGGKYSYFSGTSMATPHVAGAAALLFSHYSSLTGAQIIQTLLETAQPLSSLQGKTVTGGLLNVDKALRKWGAVSFPPTSPFLPPDQGGPAPPPAPTATPEPTPTATPQPFVGIISGAALRAGSGEPLAGVQVELRLTQDDQTTSHSALTSADGKFRFENLNGPAEFVLISSKPGFNFQDLSGAFVSSDVVQNIIGTAEVYKLDGFVLDLKGNPMSGVLVSAGALGTRVTDSKGYFQFLTFYGTDYELTIALDEDHFSPDPVRSGKVYGPLTHVFKAMKN